jgi:hypothetical protein
MQPSYPLSTLPSEPGIYALICETTKKIYIGQTVNLNRRYIEWKGAVTGGYRVSNPNLAELLKSCPNWSMKVLQLMPGATKKELDRAAHYAIQKVMDANPERLLNSMVQGVAAAAMPARYLEGNPNSNVRIETEDGRLVSKAYAAAVLGIKKDTLKKRLQKLHRERGMTAIKLEDLKK